MRYTTIIDITEYPTIRRSRNAIYLYLYMALRAGWHDADRDLLDESIRSLAYRTGLTLSATRHALDLLTRAGLISRTGTIWKVTKWVPEQPVTSRPKTARQQAQIEAEAARRREREQREREEAIERQRRQQMAASGSSYYQLYIEDLRARAAAGDQEAARALARHERNK